MRTVFFKTKSLAKKALSAFLMFGILLAPFSSVDIAYAQLSNFNKQINYQGKFTDASNIAVADGVYNMTFRLYTAASGATTTNIWEEIRISGNRVTVSNGLFSVMLGEVTALPANIWNQTLYLGVEIGGTSAVPATWDGEMSPRKKLGAVLAAFQADQLDGLDSQQFARTDATSTIATSSAQALLSLNQQGAGDILRLFAGTTQTFTAAVNGNIGIGTTSPWRQLSVVGNSDLGNNALAGYFTATSGNATSSFGDVNFAAVNTTRDNWMFWGGQNFINASSTAGNTFVGIQTGMPTTTTSNTALGYQVLQALSGGVGQNTAVGREALKANTTGGSNTAVGHQALSSNTTASSNVGIGIQALFGNTTGGSNAATGFQSLFSNTTGASNSAFGNQTLRSNTTASDNSAFGALAMRSNLTGASNAAFGNEALRFSITGANNAAFGYQALSQNISATNTTAVGYQAGLGVAGPGVSASQNNVFVGYQSGLGNTSGNNNTLIGYSSGSNLTSGSNNIILGYNLSTPLATTNNTLNIGALLFGTSIDGSGSGVSSGNIGIGTSTPWAKLSVQGTQGSLVVPLFDIASSTDSNGSATSSIFRVNSDGNVGIGTTSPSQLLTVGNNNQFTVSSTGAVEALNGRFNSNLTTNGNFFVNVGTSYFGANVGIGTTTPWAKLSIMNGNGSVVPLLDIASSTNASGSATSSLFRVNYDGTVGIGTTSPAGTLGIAGNIFTSGSATSTFASGGLALNGGGLHILNGGIRVANLNVAGCTIKTDTNGVFVCGSDAGASGSSEINWTWFNNSGVRVATSSNPVLIGGTGTTSSAQLEVQGNTYISGNVGIGTTSPWAKLSVASAVGATPFAVASSSGATMLAVDTRGALVFGTTTNSNIFINGGGTTTNTITPRRNIALGSEAFSYYAPTIFDNIALGYQALYGSSSVPMTGEGNFAAGNQALYSNTTGVYNSAIGDQALTSNTTGAYNIAHGYEALFYNTSGAGNVGNGTLALAFNTTGSYNSAHGYQALVHNTTGINNAAVGLNALFTGTTGSYNSGFGSYSLYANTTGASSTASGYQAGRANTTGNLNTFIGFNAGYREETNGAITGPSTPGNLTNAAAIGTNAQVTSSNTLVLGGRGAYSVDTVLGTTSSWAKLSIMNTNGSFVPLLDIASSTNANGSATSSLFRVNYDGNVGIGTTTPKASSETEGTVLTLSSPLVNTPSALELVGTINNFGQIAGKLGFFSQYQGTTYEVAKIAQGSGLTTPNSGQLMFSTAKNSSLLERMRITEDGFVGIGTTSPVAKLDVVGTLGSTTDLFNISTTTAANVVSSLFRVTMAGNVGIGTTSPWATLSVVGASDLGNFAQAGYFTATSGNATSSFGDINFAAVNTTRDNWMFWGGTRFMNASSTGRSTFLGLGAGSGTSSLDNTAFGYQALDALNGSAGFNTAFGSQALGANTTGDSNTAIGYHALVSNTTGGNNDAIGYEALRNNTTGSANDAWGYQAMAQNTTGANNVAVGFQTMSNNHTGTQNTAIGEFALRYNGSATTSVGIGYQAGMGVQNVTNSQNNVFLGWSAGLGNTTGSNNTLLGYNAGNNLTTGANNIILGYNLTTATITTSNTLNIGALLFGNGIDGTGTGVSSGNIGVGTSTPWAKLSVQGTQGSLVVPLFDIASSTNSNGSATTSLFVVNSNGNVGVGSSSPSALLSVDGSNSPVGTALIIMKSISGFTGNYFETRNSSGVIGTNIDSSGNFVTVAGGFKSQGIVSAGLPAAGTFLSIPSNATYSGYVFKGAVNQTGDVIRALDSTNASLFTVNSNGNTIIGTSTASAKLAVQGAYGGVLPLFDVATTTSAVFATSSLFRVNYDGNVGIGTTSPWAKLSVSGGGSDLGHFAQAGYFTATSTVASSTFGEMNIAATKTTIDNWIYWGGTRFMNASSTGGNTFMGLQTGAPTSTTNNVGIGYQALQSLSGGLGNNTALGYQTLRANTTGRDNTAMGYSMINNTTGNANTGVGTYTLNNNSSGYSSSAIGWGALNLNTTGFENTAVGLSALFYNTTGADNTAIGYQAGVGDGTNQDYRSVIDTNSTFIGTYATRDGALASTTVLDRAMAIGYNAKVKTNNSLVLGGTTTADALNVGIGVSSPWARLSVQGRSGANTVPLFDVASSTSANGFATTSLFRVNYDGIVTAPQLAYTNATGTSIYASGSSTIQTLWSTFATTTNLGVTGQITQTGAATSSFTGGLALGTGGLHITNGGLRVASLISCNTIDTDANGVMVCGTDAGASGSEINWTWFNNSGARVSTSSNAVLIGGTATTSKAQLEVVAGGSNIAAAFLSGNVGIGTSTPWAKLSVQGTQGSLVVPLFDIASSTNSNGSATSSLFRVNSNGQVLFGGSPIPSSQYVFTGKTNDSAGGITLETNGNNDYGQFYTSSNEDFYIESVRNAGKKLFLGTVNFGQTVTVDGANVGIGTTSPWRQLSVTGSSDLGTNALAGSFTATSTQASSTFGELNIAANQTAIDNWMYWGGTRFMNASSTVRNTFMGLQTGTPTSTPDNTAIGYRAMQLLQGGTGFNTAVGSLALQNNTTGHSNTALGYEALNGGVNMMGSSNTAIGSVALASDTTGDGNVALGDTALYYNTTGSWNMGVGSNSLWHNLTGDGNIGIGAESFETDTNGSQNVAIGRFAMIYAEGDDNVGVGHQSLLSTMGSDNTALGFQAGFAANTSTSSLFLGDQAGASSSTLRNLFNAIAVGSHSNVGRSNSLVLGGTGQYSTDIVTGTGTPWAKLSIMNRSGSTTPLFDIATTTTASGSGTSSLFRVNYDGKVGIGTSSPTGTLDVSGTVGGFVVSGVNLDPAQGYSLTPLQSSAKLLTGWNRSGGGGEIDLIANRASGAFGGFNFYDYSNTGTLSNLMTVQGAGNVGIGTSTPFARLTVQGAAGALTTPLFDIATSTTASGSGTSSLFRVNYDGTVGVGSSTPAGTLGIAGNIFTSGSATSTFASGGLALNGGGLHILNGGLRVANLATCTLKTDANGVVTCGSDIGGSEVNWTYNYQGLSRLSTTTSDALIGASATTSRAKLEVVAGGSNIAAAFLSGNVGIGTSTPWAKLSVQGTQGALVVPLFDIASSTNASGSATSSLFVVNSNGFVGIGTTSPWRQLSVVGNSDLGNNALAGYFTATSGNATSSFGDVNFAAVNTTRDNWMFWGGTRFMNASSTGGNTFLGLSTGAPTSSPNNTGVGYQVLNALSGGAGQNTGLGYQALTLTTTGDSNTALGYVAMHNNTTGSDNTAIGMQALYGNTTGIRNFALGRDVLFNNQGGGNNIGIGYQSLNLNVSGNFNTAIGTQALQNNTASNNNAIGFQSLNGNTSGADNVAIGYTALKSNTVSNGNTAIGRDALINSFGQYNTAIGYQAGNALTTGSSTVFIGENAGNSGTVANLSNAVAIGSNAQVTRSNTFVLGGTGTYETSVVTGTTSAWAKLAVQAAYGSTTPLFDIASTTGANGSATSSMFRVNYNGNVGIGTSAPGGILDVRYSTSQMKFLLSNAATLDPYNLGVTSANQMAVSSEAGTFRQAMIFADTSAGNEAMFGLSSSIDSGTTWVPKFVVHQDGNVGIGTSTPWAKLSIQGTQGSVSAPLFDIASSTNSIGSATSSIFRVNSNGSVDVGTTTSSLSLAKIFIDASMSQSGSTNAIAGIHEMYTFNPTLTNTTQIGDRMVILNQPSGTSATNTAIGKLIRVVDDTSISNLVRGMEVNAAGGANTWGVNTGVRAVGHTFGVQGVTTGLAGGTTTPAALYGENTGTTVGDILRLYTSTMTTATSVAQFYQEVSTFTGTGLLMNFGAGGGSFTGNFLDMQLNSNSRFKVTVAGTTTIGQTGQTTTAAGLQIGYGGICVDNDGTCSATTTGQVRAVSFATGASDLAENYFSTSTLAAGEIVMASGGEYVDRAVSTATDRVLGIVSTKPAIILGLGETLADNQYPIALAGRVPVQVTLSGGAIKMGDRITISSIPGVGMRGTASSSVTVATALEDWVGDPNVLDSAQVGTVLAFVNLAHRELSPVISGETISLRDNTGKDVPFWVVDGTTGNIKYLAEKTIDFGGQALMNIKSIGGANGKWELDENGHLVVDGIEVKGTITVGSPERRTGVTLFDKSDGAPYCVAMISGALASTPGVCDPNGGNVSAGGGAGGGTSSGNSTGGDSSSGSSTPPSEGSGSSTPSSGGDNTGSSTENSSGTPSGGSGGTDSGADSSMGTGSTDTGTTGGDTPPQTGGGDAGVAP